MISLYSGIIAWSSNGARARLDVATKTHWSVTEDMDDSSVVPCGTTYADTPTRDDVTHAAIHARR